MPLCLYLSAKYNKFYLDHFRMTYLDRRLTNFQGLVDKCAPTSVPFILLLDNIILYHGNRRRHRLFKILGPKMWNFTVRGLIVPKFLKFQHLFQSGETAEESQHDPKEVTAEDTFIGN